MKRIEDYTDLQEGVREESGGDKGGNPFTALEELWL